MRAAELLATGLIAAVAWPVSQSVWAQDTAAETGTAAQPEVQSADPGVLEEVLVRGQRMSEIEFDLHTYVQEFLGEVVALPPGGGYARWRYGLCVAVNNLERGAAQYVADRIALLAMDVGLKPGEPGCSPNVLIIFTTNADELAHELVETQPRLFRPGGPACCMQLGLDALDEFAASDEPVRWWHVSMPVDVNLGQRAIHLPQDGPGNYPIISVFGPSRVHSGVADRMERVIIIVDGTQLRGTTWEELGDYLAVVSLAQINPKADPSAFDSILNLFKNPGAYSGLTDWDRSYIQALYEIDVERLPRLQKNLIVDRMVTREREEIIE
ncbi:MAG TPA: hypothetical protein VMR74_13675 [Gammaproteobacteria bacterium]|nr:hypothetical protein [Gammaproteobacteria bacterium]